MGDVIIIDTFDGSPPSAAAIALAKNRALLAGVPVGRILDEDEVAGTQITASIQLELGEDVGHPFRGNQYVDGTHSTTKDAAESIAKTGFSSTAGKPAGGMLGRGVYVSIGSGRVAEGYETALPVRVTYSNALTVTEKELAGRSITDVPKLIANKIGAEDRFEDNGGYQAEDAGAFLQKLLVDAGYDAVIWKGKANWGDQLVALKDGMVETRSLSASIQLDFGDSEGHPFHGNQYTGPLTSRIAEEGGLTYDPHTGTEPTEGYIVAKDLPSTFIPTEKFLADEAKAKEALARFVEEHAAEYDDPSSMIGIWHDDNPEHDEVVLDVVEQFMDFDEAMQAGIDRNQQAGWDVVNKKTFDTGGTGR